MNVLCNPILFLKDIRPRNVTKIWKCIVLYNLMKQKKITYKRKMHKCITFKRRISVVTFCFILTDIWTEKANAASGMAVEDECKLKFLELKAKRNYRFIIFRIDGQQVVVEKLGSPQENYDDFTNYLPPNECRYAVYDFDFTTAENIQKSKIFFIAW